MRYSRDFIKQHLLFEMPRVPTQLGILFGMRSFSTIIAQKAADLYHKGHIEKIAVTGGMPIRQLGCAAAFLAAGKLGHVKSLLSRDFFRAVREADHMLHVLRDLKVPRHDVVLVDDQSTNTGENVQNIASTVAQFQTATVITLVSHQRRALATLRSKIDPTVTALTSVPVYPIGVTPDNWHNVWGLESYFNCEAAKTDPANDNPRTSYILRGFCTQINIEGESALVRDRSEAMLMRAQPV